MLKPITAGAAVALACIIYASVGGIAGAVLFSSALLTILYCGLPLFTGRVGQADRQESMQLPMMFALNALGALCVALAAFYAMDEETFDAVVKIAQAKLYAPEMAVLTRSLFCGALMQTAVVGFKKGSELLCVFCVAAFVASGFEHSVANVFWVFYSHASYRDAFMFLIVCIAGNGIGAKMASAGGIFVTKGGESDGK